MHVVQFWFRFSRSWVWVSELSSCYWLPCTNTTWKVCLNPEGITTCTIKFSKTSCIVTFSTNRGRNQRTTRRPDDKKKSIFESLCILGKAAFKFSRIFARKTKRNSRKKLCQDPSLLILWSIGVLRPSRNIRRFWRSEKLWVRFCQLDTFRVIMQKNVEVPCSGSTCLRQSIEKSWRNKCSYSDEFEDLWFCLFLFFWF